MLRTGEQSVHAPLTTEYLGQRPGIHTLNAGNMMFLQITSQITLTAEITAPGGKMPNHQRLYPRLPGLVVLAVDAIITNEGISHYHALSRIGGVGQKLLIS